MRRVLLGVGTLVGLVGLTGTASANPLRALFCGHGCYHHYHHVAPVAVAPPTGGGTFGGVVGFGAVPTFGAVGFGAVPAYGGYGFGAAPGFGFGAVPSYGLVPMTFGFNTGGGGTPPGFGGADGGGEFGNAAAVELAGLILQFINNRRPGGGNPGGGGGTFPGGARPPVTADLTAIHAKLDAIIVNQTVQTNAVLTAIKAQGAETDKKVAEVKELVEKVKAKTDKLPN